MNISHLHSHDANQLPATFFDLVPQRAVHVSRFPNHSTHNAIWDFAEGGNGLMYAALCNEGTCANNVELYEYNPQNGGLRFLFDAGRETLVGGREIPPSKIHTSIQPMRDGRLIMTTHNTSPSPVHPYWLFDQYYNHEWEGWPGSHILILDPRSGDVRTLGIPVRRDSIYGAVYDDRHHAYWFTTFLKGHLFRLDLTTRELCDFGQVTEFGSHCLFKDPLGHVYTSSRSGHLIRVDVDTLTLEDLGIYVDGTGESSDLWRHHRVLASAKTGSDGRIWFGYHFSDFIFALDPLTKKVERIGTFIPEAHRCATPMVFHGMAFDADGVLWVTGMFPFTWGVGNLTQLYRWDVLRGGIPAAMGVLGTRERVTAVTSKMIACVADNSLHIADSNHGHDMPVLLRVDISVLMRDAAQARERSHDPHTYLLFKDPETLCPAADFKVKAQPHYNLEAFFGRMGEFYTENSSAIQAADLQAVRLWEQLPGGESAVFTLDWSTNGRLVAGCGSDSGELRYHVTLELHDGRWRITKVTTSRLSNSTVSALHLPDAVRQAHLPQRSGRRFLAKIAAAVPWHDGSWLVATQDAMLAKVNSVTGGVYGLGAVATHGPVHQLISNAARSVAWGVAGDPCDLGTVFSYDDRRGLREAGRTFFTKDGIYSSTEPSCLALSPDGQTLAVGVKDRLGTVYLYQHITTAPCGGG